MSTFRGITQAAYITNIMRRYIDIAHNFYNQFNLITRVIRTDHARKYVVDADFI